MSWFYWIIREQCDIYLHKHCQAAAHLEGMVKSYQKSSSQSCQKKIPEGKKMIKSFIFPKVPGNTYFPEEQRGRTSQRFQTQINSTDSTSIIFWNYIQIWLSLRILPKASWHSSVSMLQKHTLMQPLYMTDSSHRISDILHFQYVKWLYFYIRNFARDLFSFREVTKPSWLFFS